MIKMGNIHSREIEITAVTTAVDLILENEIEVIRGYRGYQILENEGSTRGCCPIKTGRVQL